jgi:hypothetical protein
MRLALKGRKISCNLPIIYRSLTQNFNNSEKILLTLYTKSKCSLCDNAKEFIEENYPNRFTIEEVDITKDRVLFRKFKLDIPVFYYKGNFLMKHKADKTVLDKLIRE